MLEIEQLSKSYGDVRALDRVSMNVASAEIVGFVGANGAGKSTTMRIAMGLLAPDAGSVNWNGAALTFQARRRFGYMPEQRGLYPRMRIAEQISYFGQLRGMSRSAADAAALALIGQPAARAARCGEPVGELNEKGNLS